MKLFATLLLASALFGFTSCAHKKSCDDRKKQCNLKKSKCGEKCSLKEKKGKCCTGKKDKK